MNDENNYKNVDKQITDNYFRYYPKAFNVYEEYNFDKFFTTEYIPIYFIVICDSEETANLFGQEIKNINKDSNIPYNQESILYNYTHFIKKQFKN